MKCPPSCSLVGSNSLMGDPPPRESQRPGSFSTYRRFWADSTSWEPFILPPNFDPGPAMNRTRTEPGVYELAVTMPQAPSTVVPVYIGMSANVRRRHLAYVRDGDHIKELLAPMVAEGHTVWQRVRYLETSLQAERWEARFLVDYDYAWNTKLNPPKRNVILEHRDCCCCAVGVDVVTAAPASAEELRRESLLAAPLQTCVNDTWSVSLALQVLIAITIICVVAVQLEDWVAPGDPPPGSTTATQECLLGVASNGPSLCIYTYVVAGSSMAVSLVLAILAEITFKRGRGWHGAVEGILSGALTVWWSVAAIVLTNYSLQADSSGVPKHAWRTAVWALSWAMAGLWGLCVLVKFMVSALRCCASKAVASEFSRSYSAYNISMNGAAGASPTPTRPPAPGSKDPEVPSPTAPVFPQMAWPQQQFMTPELV